MSFHDDVMNAVVMKLASMEKVARTFTSTQEQLNKQTAAMESRHPGMAQAIQELRGRVGGANPAGSPMSNAWAAAAPKQAPVAQRPAPAPVMQQPAAPRQQQPAAPRQQQPAAPAPKPQTRQQVAAPTSKPQAQSSGGAVARATAPGAKPSGAVKSKNPSANHPQEISWGPKTTEGYQWGSTGGMKISPQAHPAGKTPSGLSPIPEKGIAKGITGATNKGTPFPDSGIVADISRTGGKPSPLGPNAMAQLGNFHSPGSPTEQLFREYWANRNAPYALGPIL